MESNARKCAFLDARRGRAAAQRTRAVVHARAEAWPDGLGAHDLVTARALAPLAVVAEYAAPLLASAGPGRLARPARRRGGARRRRERRRSGSSWPEIRPVEPIRARSTVTSTST